MRYTVATGEPALTGFMRTRPRPAFWSGLYILLFLLQVGWPASAGVASGAIFYLFSHRLPGPGDGDAVYAIGVGTFLLCVSLLVAGRRVERTLEWLNWILVTCTLGGFVVIALWSGSARFAVSSTSFPNKPISSCSPPSWRTRVRVAW
jgi:hypothetical protein